MTEEARRASKLDELPELCIIEEVCDFLRIGRTLAYELVESGQIRKVENLGRTIRIPRSELERLVRGEESPNGLQASRRGPGPEASTRVPSAATPKKSFAR